MKIANNVNYGLTAGFYGALDETDWFFDKIEAGMTYANRPQGATTGAWPGFQPFGGWKGSGASGKNGGGLYYVQLYMHEQIRTLIRPATNGKPALKGSCFTEKGCCEEACQKGHQERYKEISREEDYAAQIRFDSPFPGRWEGAFWMAWSTIHRPHRNVLHPDRSGRLHPVHCIRLRRADELRLPVLGGAFGDGRHYAAQAQTASPTQRTVRLRAQDARRLQTHRREEVTCRN